MGNGAISENDLMYKLVQAKKVMNKVDSGNFERGQIDESKLYVESNDSTMEMSQPQVRQNTKPVGTPSASINENLVLKVGDSIFKGKITGVNKAK